MGHYFLDIQYHFLQNRGKKLYLVQPYSMQTDYPVNPWHVLLREYSPESGSSRAADNRRFFVTQNPREK